VRKSPNFDGTQNALKSIRKWAYCKKQNSCLPKQTIVGKHASTDQFVENVIVEWDTFAGAVAFDIINKIRHGISSSANGNITDFVHELIGRISAGGFLQSLQNQAFQQLIILNM